MRVVTALPLTARHGVAAYPTPSNGPAAAHLVSVSDLTGEGIMAVLDHAAALKAGAGDRLLAKPLAGKSVALIFDKPSLRTRVSFEVGVARLGGTTTCLTGAEIGIGSREAVADVARTLSRYVDAIVIRTLSHAVVAELAAAAEVPVINALTELEHPCQALADLMTMREHLGGLDGRQLVFVGDGNNVCHSLMLAGAAVGLNVRVAAPHGYWPDSAVVEEATDLAQESGARVELTTDPLAAVRNADAVYTDVWASMGEEQEATERKRAFASYAVTTELMAHAAPHALAMHCLPAHRGDEITNEVIDGAHSVVFDQAENRMWVQEAVLLHLLRKPLRALRGAGEMTAVPARRSVGL